MEYRVERHLLFTAHTLPVAQARFEAALDQIKQEGLEVWKVDGSFVCRETSDEVRLQRPFVPTAVPLSPGWGRRAQRRNHRRAQHHQRLHAAQVEFDEYQRRYGRPPTVIRTTAMCGFDGPVLLRPISGVETPS